MTLLSSDYEAHEPLLSGRVTSDAFDIDLFRCIAGGERPVWMMAGELNVAEISPGAYITGWPNWSSAAGVCVSLALLRP